jgi:cysteinyl-tRNA synthetase
MSLRVYNTLTKNKELFEPLAPGKVGIYLCGPTVYRPSHIGHAVGPIIFDSINRYLQHKGYQVTFVINITDVDDKLIAEAAAQGRPVLELARELEASYLAAMDRLAVRSVDHFPRATEHIAEIIDLVKRLIDKGAAYEVNGDVYFDHTQAVGYGKLSGRSVDESLAGTRQVESKSKHPADFALWKASKPDEPAWDSPWGAGRPGWHIECSAMSMALLGETFDIHGGGIDLVFPHHENEIAQSETATGKTFARFWMHNGLTRVKTKAAGGELQDQKMSKSLGNIREISDLLEAYSGETIRAFVLSTQYRRPLDFSDEQLDNAAKSLQTFYRLFERVERITGQDPYGDGQSLERSHQQAVSDADQAFVKELLQHRLRFYEAMDDDFNTAGAIAALHAMAGCLNRYMDQAGADAEGGDAIKALAAGAAVTLVNTGRILGLFEEPPAADTAGLDSAEIDRLIAERNAARKAKDYARADAIRDQLAEMGVTIEDTPAGTVWRKAQD